MPDKPEPSEEGTSTLAAQYTRQATPTSSKSWFASGPRARPMRPFRRRFLHGSDYDEHSRALLEKLAAGGEIPDDFAKETIAASKQLKPNTTELTLTVIPSGIRQYSLAGC